MTYLPEIPPSIQQYGNNNVVNFPLTIPEGMYIAYWKKRLQKSFDDKEALLFFGTTRKNQNDFNNWVLKTYSRQFTPEQLNVDTIISSLWTKTKTLVEDQLKIHQDQALIEDEKYWQVEGYNVVAFFRFKQGIEGKTFTARQGSFLLIAANDRGK